MKLKFLWNVFKLYSWGTAKFDVFILYGDIEKLVNAISSNKFYSGLSVKSHSPIIIEGNFRKDYSQSSNFKLVCEDSPFVEIDMHWNKKFAARGFTLFFLVSLINYPLNFAKKLSPFDGLLMFVFAFLVSFIFFAITILPILKRIKDDLKIIIKVKKN